MKIRYWYILTLVVIIADLITKHLTEGINSVGIEGLFSLFSTHNTGASFSILSGAQWFFVVLASLFGIAMLLWDILNKSHQKANGWYKVGFALVLGGLLGNLIDRIVFGYVRDFIKLDFMQFPIFNIADMALTVGCVCLCIFVLFFTTEKEKIK